MRVALVHDSLSRTGGAERVLAELSHLYPEAPIFTFDARPEIAVDYPCVRTSFLQRLPPWVRSRRWTLPLQPIAAETFDLSAFDVVISSTSGFAKGVVTRPGTLHLCYCHAPPRFLWDWYHATLREQPVQGFRRTAALLVLHSLRLWDRVAARRVDLFLANSETTRQRIRRYYGREAIVVYPPVRVERFPLPVHRGSRTYFLFVGRLSPYKRAGVVVETFNKLELPLLLAGDGSERTRLQHRARSHVRLLGHVSEADLPALYAGARAVIFPSDDDLGLVPLEAMASGTPVLALRRGGARETVLEGVTGEFFDEPLEELIGDCVRRFLENESSYNPALLRRHAENFSADRFRRQIQETVNAAWHDWQRMRERRGRTDPSHVSPAVVV